MVKKTQLKVHRKITAKAIDVQGNAKEWNDNQIVMAGEFDSQVAKQDPNISVQEFGITFKKVQGVDCEKNRYFMRKSFETWQDVGEALKQ